MGYVPPGVIQIIEDMQETDDKYSITSNAIGVVAKPKLVYPSTATNWINDMYATRLQFPEQHEINTESKPTTVGEERSALSNLVFLENTLVQYLLMDIANDYMNITNGGGFLDREILRHNVLLKRVKYITEELNGIELYQHHILKLEELTQTIKEFLEQLPSLITLLPEDIDSAFSEMSIEVKDFRSCARRTCLVIGQLTSSHLMLGQG